MATEVIIGDGGPGTVRMYGCVTRQWDQEAEYDPSGTDLVRQKLKLTFEGTVHAQGASLAGYAAAVTTYTTVNPKNVDLLPSPTKISILRGLMLTPRKDITVYMNGTLALYAAALPGPDAAQVQAEWVDIDNGPKPRGCNVTRIVGDNTFRMVFSVELNLIRCTDSSPISGTGAYPVVNNRWSISESMDRDFFTKRTIRGRLRTSTSLWPAHSYRGFCFPALEAGFARESIEYEVADNGLDVTYQVTDTQVHTAAPWPATQIEATNTEETLDGVNFISSMAVRLKGAPSSPKPALIAQAVNIADSRLNYFNQGPGETKALLVNFSLIEHIGPENIIDLNMTIKRFQEDIGSYIANLMGSQMGQPLDLPTLQGGEAYNPGLSHVPAQFGYNPGGDERSPGVLFLLSCYLQDPCSPKKSIYRDQQQPSEAPDIQGVLGSDQTQISQVSPGTLDGGDYSQYSQDQKTAIYTMARMQSRYSEDCKAVNLAILDSTSTGDTAVAVELSGGRASRTIIYDAERIGLQPQIPAASLTYVDGNIRGTLLKNWLEVHPPTLSADGIKKVYRVTAYYKYGLNRPPSATDKIRVGVLPFTSFSQDDNSYNLKDGINSNLGP